MIINAHVSDQDVLVACSPSGLAAYLRSQNWVMQAKARRSVLWTKIVDSGSFEVEQPTDLSLRDYLFRVHDVLKVLALVEDRCELDVLMDMTDASSGMHLAGASTARAPGTVGRRDRLGSGLRAGTAPPDFLPFMPQPLEKVAWVLLDSRRILVSRNKDRKLFFLPGGGREPGESDAETLVREVSEELGAVVDPATMSHVGTFVGLPGTFHENFRMICYTARHQGELSPQNEIAEIDWFTYRDYDRVTDAEQYIFDLLLNTNRLAHRPAS